MSSQAVVRLTVRQSSGWMGGRTNQDEQSSAKQKTGKYFERVNS